VNIAAAGRQRKRRQVSAQGAGSAMFAVAPHVHQRSTDAHQRALRRRQRELERQQDVARAKTAELLGRPRPGRLGTAEVAFGVGEHAEGVVQEVQARERRRRHTMGPIHVKEVAERHVERLRERREHLRHVHDQAEEKEARAAQTRRELAEQRAEALREAAATRQAKRKAVVARKSAAAAEKLATKAARTEARHANRGSAGPKKPSPRGAAPRHEYTALHKACAQGDLEAVKMLLEAGASSSVAAPGGHTPLEMAALGGHRAVVLRILQHRQPSEAEKIRCAKFAMRRGYADVAALVVPPKLAKATPRTPSQAYAATGVLEPYTMRDGFYEAGTSAAKTKEPLRTLAHYAAMSPNLALPEVVLVDARQDQELQAFVQRVRAEIAKLDSPDDTAAKVAVLQTLVRSRLGLAAAQSRADMETRSKTAIWSLQRQRRSRVISLGSVRLGVPRHQALLFKYLADNEDVKIPCKLVRGHGDEEGQVWVDVHYVDGSGEDRWQPIGRATRQTTVNDESQKPETQTAASSTSTATELGETVHLDDGTTVASGTSADTYEGVTNALSSQPKPGTSAAKRAAAAEKARAQTPLGRIEAALDACLAHGKRGDLPAEETWGLLKDTLSDPEVVSEAIKMDEPAPPQLRLCPIAAELREGLFDGTVSNMASLHKGYSGGWLAEHRRRPPTLRLV
jgi:hypothetical protein